MKKISHISLGILSAVLFNTPITTSILGSLAPDLDVKWSKPNVNRGLLGSHRGITHHLIVAFFLLFSLFFIKNIWYKGFVIGYISHLFGDLLTMTGIPYRKHKDRISLKLFKTGDLFEYVFLFLLFLVIISISVYSAGPTSVLPFEFRLAFQVLLQKG